MVNESLNQNVIQIKKLSKTYDDGKNNEIVNIISDVNLEIKKGEFFILLGPSGCGKSTLLNLIAGFINKSSGSLLIDNKEITRPGKDRGVVFQNADAAIFPWRTVQENVEFGLKLSGIKAKERKKIADEYIKLVGLENHANKYPDELSGGMKQRVQLARVLANDSEILIMDEPFGALDAQTRHIMQKELIRIWSQTDKTVIFVTHDIQEAILLGQRIGIMSFSPDATIYKIYDIKLSYPRNDTDQEFISLYKNLQTHFDYGAGI